MKNNLEVQSGPLQGTNDIPTFSSLSVGSLVLLGIEPRILYMLSKSSTAELYSQNGREERKEDSSYVFHVHAEID